MKAHVIIDNDMRKLDINDFSALSYEELVGISGGGTEPGDLMRDLGRVVGKIGGWIVNAFTTESEDQWMLDVDPKLLFG